MNDVRPVDYLVIGLINALYSMSKNQASHSITYGELITVFETHYKQPLQLSQLELAVARMEHEQIVSLVRDPYADTVIETTDKRLAEFADSVGGVIGRGWTNEEWLKSAFRNLKLWEDINSGVDLIEVFESVPSADGFVTIDHNSPPINDAELSLIAADEAIRSDNEFDSEHRNWIRSHLEAGIALLRRGGPVLRSALISLIVEPLKAAAKVAANDHAKSLINAAIVAIRSILGI